MKIRQLLPVIVFLTAVFMAASHFSIDTPLTPQAKTYGQFINIYDEPVELSDYFGRYLWVDYAAEWCSYCNEQTQTLKHIANSYSGKLDFLTIVTGTDKVMKAPTVETIRAWTDKHNLDPRMVIGRFYTDRLPYNLLYTPEGTVVYRGSGLMQESQIRQILSQHIK